jgi:predicted ribosome quality control (RQC) complex YloA/Tae2 family protein
LVERWKKHEDESCRRQEEECRRQEQLRLQAEEQERRTALIAEAARWQSAKLITEYLAHLERAADQASINISDNPEFGRWCKWAKTVALDLDPTRVRLASIL